MTPTTRVTLAAKQRGEIARGRFVRVGAGPETYLVGRVDGAWKAYVNVCRHRSLPLDLGARTPMSDDARYLMCSQHGALYRLEDGKCVVGPCTGESLAEVPVREERLGQAVELVIGG